MEIDELVIRFRVKRRYRYLWLAISRLTRQVIGFTIGDRSVRSLKRLWFSLPAAYRRKLVYSDFYRAYAKWFAPWQHRPSAKGSGKTSVVEGLNNKWRNRVSGLVRKTVCVRYMDDLQRRLWLVIQAHNLLPIRQIELCSVHQRNESQYPGRLLSPVDVRQLTVYAELEKKRNPGTSQPNLMLLYPFIGQRRFEADSAMAWNDSLFFLMPVKVDVRRDLSQALPQSAVHILTKELGLI